MHDRSSIPRSQDRTAPVVALVGNPNVGKSAIFSLLTGRYAIVSNYPGTTVEVMSGFARLGGRRAELVDTPGVNSLIPRSEDEEVARSILLDRAPQAVVQVVDAKNLRRGLQITAQLAEMGLPIVLDLNIWDESVDRGIAIDTAGLSRLTGVPVVKTVATQKMGIDSLAGAVANAAPPRLRVDYGSVIEDAIAGLEPMLPETSVGKRALAVMLLSGDAGLEQRIRKYGQHDADAQAPETGKAAHGEIDGIQLLRAQAQAKLGEPLSYVISKKRAAYVDTIVAEVVSVRRTAPSSQAAQRLFFWFIGPALGFLVSYLSAALLLGAAGKFVSLGIAGVIALWGITAGGCVAYSLYLRRERGRTASLAVLLGNITMHRVLAFPILVAVLWCTYLLVGVLGSGVCVDFIESVIFGSTVEPSGGFSILAWHVPFNGINYYLAQLADHVGGRDNLIYQIFLAEDAGLIRVGLTYAIAIVLPIVGFFFLAFGVMEDSGYLPRLAVMVDWIFKKIGLNGKAVLPIVLGFGCDTMATLTTRILETRREQIIATLLLALAIPCSAQLGIISGVLSDIGGGGAFALYVFVIASQFLFVGYLASKILRGKNSDFLLEIPPFRKPLLANVVIKTYYRVKWFMKEAVPLFLVGTLALFISTRTGYNESTRPLGLLSYADRIGAPITQHLLGLPGLPEAPNETHIGGRPGAVLPDPNGAAAGGVTRPHSTTQAFILGFLRRDYGAVAIRENFRSGFFSARQAMVTLIVITLFVPCLANLLVIIKERGPLAASLIIGFIIPYSFLVGAVLNWVLSTTKSM